MSLFEGAAGRISVVRGAFALPLVLVAVWGGDEDEPAVGLSG
ncbi:hypothetical protein [Streptomyces sp. 147326]